MAIQRFDLERTVLQRLRDGLLDGIVGTECTLGKITTRVFVENGRPFIGRYPANTTPTRETLNIEKEFETEEGKLWFIRNHGWLMDDVYACLYSYMFRRTGNL